MLFKMLRGPWFANYASFASVLAIGFCAVDFKRAISLLKAIKDSRKSFCIRHFYKPKKGALGPRTT